MGVEEKKKHNLHVSVVVYICVGFGERPVKSQLSNHYIQHNDHDR